jgi:hypothetical protein
MAQIYDIGNRYL